MYDESYSLWMQLPVIKYTPGSATYYGRAELGYSPCVLYLQPTSEQADVLQEAFMNCISARQHGIHFNGATYKCVRADKGSIYAKKVSILCDLVPTDQGLMHHNHTGRFWVCCSQHQ